MTTTTVLPQHIKHQIHYSPDCSILVPRIYDEALLRVPVRGHQSHSTSIIPEVWQSAKDHITTSTTLRPLRPHDLRSRSPRLGDLEGRFAIRRGSF